MRNKNPHFLIILASIMFGFTTSAQCPSTRIGKGPVVHSNGVMFRVWAPNADSVHVAGTFNNWSTTAHPLCSEGTGYFSADISSVTNKSQYKFVIRRGTAMHWRRDPRGRAVVNSLGNSIIDDPRAFGWDDAASTLPNWNEMIIYQLHIGTFHDPTPSNNVPATFFDAAAKLDHIAELGANMVELLPVNEFPGAYSWGYNPSEVFSVESSYGGVAGLRHFVNEAHRRNIGVIMDVVYNHLGPNDMQSLWQFDGWAVTNSAGGIYFYQDWRNATPWGNTRPDFSRAEVRWFVGDNILMWLDECHVDGFRWDATAYIRNVYGNNNDPASDLNEGWGMMMEANNRLDQAAPWAISIAEDMRANTFITRKTSEGGAGFDSQWDPDFVHPVRAAVIASNDAGRSMWSVHSAITRKENNDAMKRVIYTESHDEVANGKKRVPSEIDVLNPGSYQARKRSTLGAAVLMTSPGIPMIFMGQEMLEDDWFTDTNPIDWQKKNTFAGTFLLYQDLMLLRKNRTGATRGLTGQHINAYHVNDFNKVIAYHRWSSGGVGDDVVVVANFGGSAWAPASNYRIGLPRPGVWYPVFNSDAARYGADFSNLGGQPVYSENLSWNNQPYSATVSFGPYSVLVLSQANGSLIDEAPSVGFTFPSLTGQLLTRNVELAASAADDRGVTRVEFYVDDFMIAADASAPYAVSWDTRTAANGPHIVKAIAYDAANQSAEDVISILVENTDLSPRVSITSPTNGAILAGVSDIAVSASDDDAVSTVRFFVNGVLAATDAVAPYLFAWDTRATSNGFYEVEAVAIDTAAQTSTGRVAVVVENIDRVPVVAITSPTNTARVSGTINVSATASDDGSVSSVQFFVNDLSVANDVTAPYGFVWNTTSLSNGVHSIRAVVRDNAGQIAEQTIAATVSNSLLVSSFHMMSVAGNFSGSGWNPTLNRMTLVSNYTWQGVVTINSSKTTEFKFAANGNWTMNWGDNSQSNRKIPLNDTADQSGANIKIDPRLSGSYQFTFNEQTRRYSVIKR